MSGIINAMFSLKKPPSKYKAVDRHFEIIEAISKTKDEARLIALCTEDIKLVHSFKREYAAQEKENAEWLKKINKEHNIKAKPPKPAPLPKSYPSFKKLAIIYEKHKEYDKAIQVCEEAISSGFTYDGTDGGMKARLKKLKEKAEKADK